MVLVNAGFRQSDRSTRGPRPALSPWPETLPSTRSQNNATGTRDPGSPRFQAWRCGFPTTGQSGSGHSGVQRRWHWVHSVVFEAGIRFHRERVVRALDRYRAFHTRGTVHSPYGNAVRQSRLQPPATRLRTGNNHRAPREMLEIDFGALEDIVYYRVSGQILAHQDANVDRLLTLIEFVTTEMLTIHTLWLTCCDWLGGDLHPGRHSPIRSRRNRPAQCTHK